MTVRTLDAVHLETAVGLQAQREVDAVMTYDHQLQAGCAHHGIPVVTPLVA